MKYIVKNIEEIEVIDDIPESFIKNRYSKYEYSLIKKYLNEFYKIKEFNIKYTTNGKPYLDNNIFISITTSEELVGIAFSNRPIGIDIEHIHEIKSNVRKFLNIPQNISTIEALINFCSKEAIIKLEGLTLKEIKKINVNNYKITKEINNNYIIIIAENI